MSRLQPWRFSCAVRLPTRELRAECLLVPARPMSHESILSPAWTPGGPERVEDLQLFENGINVTSQFSERYLAAIREALLKASHQPYSVERFIAVVEDPLLPACVGQFDIEGLR